MLALALLSGAWALRSTRSPLRMSTTKQRAVSPQTPTETVGKPAEQISRLPGLRKNNVLPYTPKGKEWAPGERRREVDRRIVHPCASARRAATSARVEDGLSSKCGGLSMLAEESSSKNVFLGTSDSATSTTSRARSCWPPWRRCGTRWARPAQDSWTRSGSARRTSGAAVFGVLHFLDARRGHNAGAKQFLEGEWTREKELRREARAFVAGEAAPFAAWEELPSLKGADRRDVSLAEAVAQVALAVTLVPPFVVLAP